MMNNIDIMHKLMKLCTDQSKQILEEVNQFFPVCFYLDGTEYRPLIFQEWSGSAKEYFLELKKVFEERETKSYCIAVDIAVTVDTGEKLNAIELNLTYDRVEYAKCYHYYSKNSTGVYEYSDLIELN